MSVVALLPLEVVRLNETVLSVKFPRGMIFPGSKGKFSPDIHRSALATLGPEQSRRRWGIRQTEVLVKRTSP